MDKYIVAENIIKYCNKNNIEIDNLKLQKLLYFYQKNHYILTKKLAFNDEFQAYRYGPVMEDVWKRYKDIDLSTINSELDIEKAQNISNILGAYLYFDVWYLVEESHKSKTWKKMKNYFKGIMRNDDLIKEWNNEV